jgi:hypothetical protein
MKRGHFAAALAAVGSAPSAGAIGTIVADGVSLSDRAAQSIFASLESHPHALWLGLDKADVTTFVVVATRTDGSMTGGGLGPDGAYALSLGSPDGGDPGATLVGIGIELYEFAELESSGEGVMPAEDLARGVPAPMPTGAAIGAAVLGGLALRRRH